MAYHTNSVAVGAMALEAACALAPSSAPSHFSQYIVNSTTYRRFIPLRDGPRWTPRPGIRSENETVYYLHEADWDACPRASAEPGFKRLCNEKEGGACVTTRAAMADAPALTTAAGEPVQRAIQRALRTAWGDDPPHIDFYVRCGCMGTNELQYLQPSIELFWPEFVGDVIIVLDAGNHATLEHFLPLNWRTTRHS